MSCWRLGPRLIELPNGEFQIAIVGYVATPRELGSFASDPRRTTADCFDTITRMSPYALWL